MIPNPTKCVYHIDPPSDVRGDFDARLRWAIENHAEIAEKIRSDGETAVNGSAVCTLVESYVEVFPELTMFGFKTQAVRVVAVISTEVLASQGESA